MLRLGALVLGVAIAVAAVASSASAALFFLLKPTTAKPGDLVTVRLGGTPPGFTTSQRKKPFKPPIRLYLVAGDEADEIRSRLDRRLSFIGRIVADRNSRGLLTFTVPPLDTNDYVLAYWCPGCARYGSDTFGVQTIPRVSRYRHLMGLRVEMPDPTETCPVTIPRSSSTGRFTYGNGLLATTVPRDGVVVASRYEPDGSLFWKPYWLPRGPRGSPACSRFAVKGWTRRHRRCASSQCGGDPPAAGQPRARSRARVAGESPGGWAISACRSS